jgi:hypothetical protein
MDRDDVRQQIDKILGSESFAGKNRLRTLLEILFNNMDSQTTLRPDRVIKELWPEETKTKRSADVATEKNRLRRALESYYSAEGNADPIIVSLPNRSMPGPDGMKERRWIVAEPRGAFEDVAPATVPRVNSRLSLKIAAVIAAVSLAAYIPYRMLSAVDPPRSGRLDGETLTIMNGEGKELWRKSFPDGFWRQYYEQGLAPRIWFGDLDGDGHSDVLLLYHPAVNPLSHSTTLICFSDRGKEKWRWTPGRTLPELEGGPAVFTIVGLGVLKAAPGQHRRIVVSGYHQLYYPHQIAIVDANGKTISEYWHSGHLDYLRLADMDGSGQEKIVATGIANGYRQATLIVLDPDRVSGASAETARPELQLHGMGVAKERLRLLFPRSDLNQALSVYNAGMEPAIVGGMIRFSVLECELLPRCYVWYEFDKNFKLISAIADDQFRSAHKEFYLKSKTDHPFSAEEESRFWKIRCLAGCEDSFVPVETH